MSCRRINHPSKLAWLHLVRQSQLHRLPMQTHRDCISVDPRVRRMEGRRSPQPRLAARGLQRLAVSAARNPLQGYLTSCIVSKCRWFLADDGDTVVSTPGTGKCGICIDNVTRSASHAGLLTMRATVRGPRHSALGAGKLTSSVPLIRIFRHPSFDVCQVYGGGGRVYSLLLALVVCGVYGNRQGKDSAYTIND